MTATYRRSGRLAALLAGGAIALASCSNSSSPPGSQGTGSPTVASLPPSTTATTTSGHGGGSTTTTLPKTDNATVLVDEWATCLRRHGDPKQTDPTIDSHGGINIIVPQEFSTHQFGEDLHNATGTCSQYLAAAQKVLRVEFPAPSFVPDEALIVQYAACMRANGVPNFPDPTGDRTNFEWHQHEQPGLRKRQQSVRQADQRASLVDQRLGAARRHQFLELRTRQRPHASQWGAGHGLRTRLDGGVPGSFGRSDRPVLLAFQTLMELRFPPAHLADGCSRVFVSWRDRSPHEEGSYQHLRR